MPERQVPRCVGLPEDWNNHAIGVWLFQKWSWFASKKHTMLAVQSAFWVIVQRIQIRHNIRKFFYLLLVLAEPPPDFDVGRSNEARELPTSMFIGDFEKDDVSKSLSCDHSISAPL